VTRTDPAVLSALKALLPREPEEPQTGRALAMRYLDTSGRSVHVRRIGEAVRALREHGLYIESSGAGYRIVTDPAKVCAWEAREERRAKAILYAAGARKRIGKEEVERRIGQMGLFG